MRGRQRERQALDALLADVRADEGRVLVVRGEAGVGKSALLDYLAERAAGCQLLRATGVESEMELPYAGLHQFCAPILPHLDALPQPQRVALGTAFGLNAGAAANPFLVGLAVLSLMAQAAGERPLVCLLDDAQWLDRPSALLLAFVARRLLAEPIAMVFAVREPSEVRELAGLPELTLDGLAAADARALLDSVMIGRVDDRIRDRIVAETRGNPLALLELPHGLSVGELAGGFALPDARPLARRIEQSYLQRVRRLPDATQDLLLVAAAEPMGDAELLRRATERLGMGAGAAAPAESAGLIEVDLNVRFCHPLARSAVYRAATARARSEVHRALAESTDPEADPDRRAWHLGRATLAPDEAVAASLERSADRARSRGGSAAEAAFLKRAADLTPEPGPRAARALAAARATFEAGAPEAAHELLIAAEVGPLDDLQRARLGRLHAQIEFARRRGSEAPPMLLEAALRLEPLNAELARETFLEAFAAALFTGRFDASGSLVAIAEAARAAPAGPRPPRPIDLLLDGLATRFTAGHAAGVPLLRAALAAFEAAAAPEGDASTPWLWLAWFVAGDLWDSDRWYGLAERATALAREAGALNILPVCLESAAAARVYAGEFTAAAALVQESDSISEATGNAPLRYSSLVLAAWRGDEARTAGLVEARLRDAVASGEGRVVGLAEYASGVLYNGLSRYDAALAAARRACEHDDLELSGFALLEVIEAGAHSDAHDASVALERLEERTLTSGSDWALGVLARSRALLSAGSTAEALFQEAIDYLERSHVVVHLARAHLVYGEWLRRENRRAQARGHLRTAHEMLSDFGAEAFAERARRELLATGETVRRRTLDSRDLLTPQELQIARLAAMRHTNPEIGSQLYISPRTVEYHLHKVFAKLSISSRKELEAALGSVEQPARAARRPGPRG
ncbi:MAG TPA: AAA family ATPase [Trueperaceae bacterium]